MQVARTGRLAKKVLPKSSRSLVISVAEELTKALDALEKVAKAGAKPTILKHIKNALVAHATTVQEVWRRVDSVQMPKQTFDPSDPKTVGRMVSLALLAQPLEPLGSIEPSYGSGVYAIYYVGNHPLYKRISGTQTPIYVGKADPKDDEANSSQEQGTKLTDRLCEHAKTIQTVEQYVRDNRAKKTKLASHVKPIRLAEFVCRRLVCATHAQLAAEQHLIRVFMPIWNNGTDACWGMSKHGDSADVRKNKRSPWDVIHPGRKWASSKKILDSRSPTEIKTRINEVLDAAPLRSTRAQLLKMILDDFRQH